MPNLHVGSISWAWSLDILRMVTQLRCTIYTVTQSVPGTQNQRDDSISFQVLNDLKYSCHWKFGNLVILQMARVNVKFWACIFKSVVTFNFHGTIHIPENRVENTTQTNPQSASIKHFEIYHNAHAQNVVVCVLQDSPNFQYISILGSPNRWVRIMMATITP